MPHLSQLQVLPYYLDKAAHLCLIQHRQHPYPLRWIRQVSTLGYSDLSTSVTALALAQAIIHAMSHLYPLPPFRCLETPYFH